jgi:alpha-galactosidase
MNSLAAASTVCDRIISQPGREVFMEDASSGGKTGNAGLTRRAFLECATVAGLGTASGVITTSAHGETPSTRAHSHVDLRRDPDSVTAYSRPEIVWPLSRSGQHWRARSIDVEVSPLANELPMHVSAPEDSLTHLHIRWTASLSPELLCMGDAWERSYGELAWRGLVPERAMPWYFATYNGTTLDGYGVKTGANALCFWQADPEGISLWLDLSNGGAGVKLGERRLLAATVIARQAQPGETPLQELRKLCNLMCEKPRLSIGPIYGSNDWYYAYGNNSHAQTLKDADLMASLRPAQGPKPFTVIDDGWTNKAKFPDMSQLAAQIKERGVRPGIWVRPLIAPASASPSLLLPAARFGERRGRASDLAFDPTIPEALHIVSERVSEIRAWGYELLKHDYSTYDLLGQWGFEMSARPTQPGWSFHDRSRTNAEIVSDLYRAIRIAAGEPMQIIGCNTIGHLGAGIFDMQRTGDDNSGKLWERTRRMGVNTLAFRLPQHESFFVLDADCVPITQGIPWEKTRQWLDLVARSKTALFVSAAPDATGPEQKTALAAAFAIANEGGVSATPSDWFHSTTPETWSLGGGKTATHYQWSAPDGAWPFGI